MLLKFWKFSNPSPPASLKVTQSVYCRDEEVDKKLMIFQMIKKKTTKFSIQVHTRMYKHDWAILLVGKILLLKLKNAPVVTTNYWCVSFDIRLWYLKGELICEIFTNLAIFDVGLISSVRLLISRVPSQWRKKSNPLDVSEKSNFMIDCYSKPYNE